MQQNIIDLMNKLDLKGAIESFKVLNNEPAYLEKTPCSIVLQSLLEAEINHRDKRRQEALLKTSRLPLHVTISDWNFNEERDTNEFRLKVTSLLSLNFIERGQNLNVLGGSGTGKTFFMSLIGCLACSHGKTVVFYNTNELINSIKLSRGSASYYTKIKTLSGKTVLMLDDFCLFEYDEEEQAILFDILNARFGKKTTIIGSQKSMIGWRETLGETALSESIIERAGRNNFTLVMPGVSRRANLD